MNTQHMSWAQSSAHPSVAESYRHTSPRLSSTSSDSPDCDLFEPSLTSQSRHRLQKPSPAISEAPPPFAISSLSYNNSTTQCQDVRSVNPSASFTPPSPAPRFDGLPSAALESPLSSQSTPHHVPLSNDSIRPWTSSFFTSPQDLAAHYGIPQNLPPVPRPVPSRSSQQPDTSFDFESIRKNYLAMLSHKPSDIDTTASNAVTAISDDIQAIHDLLASPEFQSQVSGTSPLLDASPLFEDQSFDVDAYLTSPMETPYDDFATSPVEDSPFSDFLTTPVLPSASEADMLTSPLIEDVGYNDNMDLFGGVPAFPTYEVSPPPKLPPTTELYTISPSTPTLDFVDPATTVFPSKPQSTAPPSEELTRRRSTATGTRKNLKPEALIPMDAPTQKRAYVTPSATSRKAVPAAFAQKKRLHSAAFKDEEEEEEELAPLSPTASEQEAIEHKRRQNTLAARKSRKRKLEHQHMLEQEVEALQADRNRWRTRALLGQEMLKANGIVLPFDD